MRHSKYKVTEQEVFKKYCRQNCGDYTLDINGDIYFVLNCGGDDYPDNYGYFSYRTDVFLAGVDWDRCSVMEGTRHIFGFDREQGTCYTYQKAGTDNRTFGDPGNNLIVGYTVEDAIRNIMG